MLYLHEIQDGLDGILEPGHHKFYLGPFDTRGRVLVQKSLEAKLELSGTFKLSDMDRAIDWSNDQIKFHKEKATFSLRVHEYVEIDCDTPVHFHCRVVSELASA